MNKTLASLLVLAVEAILYHPNLLHRHAFCIQHLNQTFYRLFIYKPYVLLNELQLQA